MGARRSMKSSGRTRDLRVEREDPVSCRAPSGHRAMDPSGRRTAKLTLVSAAMSASCGAGRRAYRFVPVGWACSDNGTWVANVRNLQICGSPARGPSRRLRTPEKVTPPTKPKTPNTRGTGTSGLVPVISRTPSIMIMLAPDHAAAHVSPIPMAPRIRLSHFFTAAFARVRGHSTLLSPFLPRHSAVPSISPTDGRKGPGAAR